MIFNITRNILALIGIGTVIFFGVLIYAIIDDVIVAKRNARRRREGE